MNPQNLPKNIEQLLGGLPACISSVLRKIPLQIIKDLHEVRIRSEAPLMLTVRGQPFFVSNGGETSVLSRPGLFMIHKQDVAECFRAVCGYSLHTHQHEISNGFVVMQGGHRAGIAGTAVIENDKVTGFREITSINLRVARQVKGCSSEILKHLNGNLCGFLIAGPPSSGKTTLLRDLARSLSCGELGQVFRVAVIDERGELAAAGAGSIQNDLGPSVDVITGCPKAIGIQMAVRTLSPDVIILDEIGGQDEVSAVIQGLNAGVKTIGSIHAGNLTELLRRNQFYSLSQAGAFEKVVLLEGRINPCRLNKWFEMEDLYAQINGNFSGGHCVDRRWNGPSDFTQKENVTA